MFLPRRQPTDQARAGKGMGLAMVTVLVAGFTGLSGAASGPLPVWPPVPRTSGPGAAVRRLGGGHTGGGDAQGAHGQAGSGGRDDATTAGAVLCRCHLRPRPHRCQGRRVPGRLVLRADDPPGKGGPRRTGS